MRIEARFRRRAKACENPLELNDKLLRQLSTIRDFWDSSRTVSDAAFDPGSGESAATDLSPCLVHGTKGSISYASRLPTAIVDKAVSDDSLVVQLDTDTTNFYWLSRELFPQIVRLFEPYRAVVVTDLDRDLDDFEEIVREARLTGRDVDGRDTVFRLHPVNYFDHTMCMRAFGMETDQLANSLRESIVLAEPFQDGVLLVVSTEPAVGEQSIAIDNLVNRLKVPALNLVPD